MRRLPEKGRRRFYAFLLYNLISFWDASKISSLIDNVSTNCIAGGDIAKKFKLPAVPKTTQKNIHFPNNIIEEAEAAIRGTDVTFSAFVIEATKVALEHLQEEESE